TLTSLWNQFLNLLFPILAVFLLAVTGEQAAAAATVAFVGAAVLGIVIGGVVVGLVSARVADDMRDLGALNVDRARRKIRRGPVNWGGSSFERFREDAGEFLERKWPWLTLTSLAGSLTVFGVLLVSLRAVGVTSAQVSLVEVFAAWALVRIIA